MAEVAVRDLEEIVAFIARDSQANAERVLERIERRSATLESTPESGQVVPELARLGMRTWREFVVKSYRLIYPRRAIR